MIPATVLQALTLIEQRKLSATTLKGKVCELLGWSEEQYATFQYECGLEYMQLYTLDDPMAIEALERSKIFWNWWKNAWANRDESYVQMYDVRGTKYDVDKLTKKYLQLHDALQLAEELRPDAIVLGDSYKAMIGEVIKEVVSN